MRTLVWRLVSLLALGLPVACQRQNAVELTLVARSLNLETQIVALRETATVNSERQQVTVEYMATRAEVARRQRQGLEATLVARGSPAPGSVVPTSTPFPLPGTSVAAAPTAAVAPSLTPLAIAPGQAALTDVVMSAFVRNDDCASDPGDQFTTSSARIYVVARAYNIRAGTLIAARFAIAGQEVLLEWRPNTPINGNCIWFYIDQSDAAFISGTWSVRLELDAVPASDAIPFTIRGADR